MTKEKIVGIIMSALFIAGEAVEVDAFAELTDTTVLEINNIVDELIKKQKSSREGLILTRIEDKLQLRTNGEYSEYINALFIPPVKETLTDAMLETLSVIAYKQPATRSEVNDIRGVQSNYAVSELMKRNLIKEAGRKDVLGRPALLITTEEFLRHFAISSLDELPQIETELQNPEEASERKQQELNLVDDDNLE